MSKSLPIEVIGNGEPVNQHLVHLDKVVLIGRGIGASEGYRIHVSKC